MFCRSPIADARVLLNAPIKTRLLSTFSVFFMLSVLFGLDTSLYAIQVKVKTLNFTHALLFPEQLFRGSLVTTKISSADELVEAFHFENTSKALLDDVFLPSCVK